MRDLPPAECRKLMLAFLGTHVPLLALTAHLARDPRPGPRDKARVLALAATLGGTAATLWALHALLAPVTAASEVLRSLEEMVVKDHLTGVLNRRAGEGRLAQDAARARRGGGGLALALLDLDRFKPVNDLHGHCAGDACLEHFASVLVRNLREGDWVARWGGDEFAVGLWEGQGEEPSAERVLERAAEELRRVPLVLPDGGEARLTFSGGVSRWREGEDAEGLFRRADEALYRAKEAGGDAVVYAD